MQDKRKEALRELQKNNSTGSNLAGKLMSETTSENKSGNRVHYPEFWRKKRLNPEFVKQLQETANKEAVISDEHGEYKDGVFLHGCAIVVVTITNDLWSLEIHSEHPVGLHVIKEIRYKYLPDAFLMAQLFPSRKEKGNVIVLYQIPDSFVDDTKSGKEADDEVQNS